MLRDFLDYLSPIRSSKSDQVDLLLSKSHLRALYIPRIRVIRKNEREPLIPYF
jgi:hypothetical protein